MRFAMFVVASMAVMAAFRALTSVWRIWWPLRHIEWRLKVNTMARDALKTQIPEGQVRPSVMTCVRETAVMFAWAGVDIVAVYVVLDAVQR